MSLKPSVIQPVPEETVRIARAAFPKGNLYLSMRDELGIAFSDCDFRESGASYADSFFHVAVNQHSPLGV